MSSRCHHIKPALVKAHLPHIPRSTFPSLNRFEGELSIWTTNEHSVSESYTGHELGRSYITSQH